MRAFIDLGGLKPGHHVLEPGCGTGRIAQPLTRYLSEDGTYDGFDVVAAAIDQCNANIAARHPNFRFRLLDIRNPAYNPDGTLDSTEFSFPYPDQAFDFVFLTSVFTHMLPAEVANYLGEIHRVLRAGGRCLMTFFLLNDEARAAIRAGRTHRRFAHEGDGYFYDIEDVREGAVAYEQHVVETLIERRGFGFSRPIEGGRWAGRSGRTFGQDLIVVERP